MAFLLIFRSFDGMGWTQINVKASPSMCGAAPWSGRRAGGAASMCASEPISSG